jgi:tetratricopeptide (TPR) repeat protein
MTSIPQVLQLGWQRQRQGDYVGAANAYQQVLTVDPANADAWCYLGILHYELGQFQQSVQAYQQALHFRPQFPVALSNLGNTLAALRRFAEAEASLHRALELKPDYANAWSNLGAALVKQGKWQEAEQCFRQALAIAPQNEPANRNLGAVLVRQAKFEEALAYSEKALQTNPNSAEAHRNRAIVHLLLGNWEQGLDEYEWRWHCAEQSLPKFSQPAWSGEPLADKTLFLLAEQGLGDTLQFCRYARLARHRGARVVLQVQQELLPLFQHFTGADQVIGRRDPLPDFDYYLPLLSSPRAFGSQPHAVPQDVPYLAADPRRVEKWRQELPATAGLRVAIAWQGSRTNFATAARR